MAHHRREPDLLDRLESEQREASGTRVEFHAQLAECDGMLIDVTRRVAEQIVPVTRAFLAADAHAARRCLADGGDIDQRCRRLEEACYVLIARQSPVGADLRRLVAILRSVADTQRSWALVGHVVGALTWVHPPALTQALREIIAQLGDVAAEMFASSATAWAEHDALAASDLEQRDDQADLLQKSLLTELYTGPSSVEEAVSLALLARYYERVADHGVEIARHVAYMVTGHRPGLDS
ncbi:MAG TPA: phosphate uptake regulator PhoU [Egibacteraceae bacterium]|nr:phosphate uptake regulator PhoU [Egibacteraceae bacterium]